MKRAGWSRDTFDRACASLRDGRLVTRAEPADGWTLRPCWGLHRDGGWHLTHLPTGMLIPGGFDRLADGKRFAEELSAEVDCNVGRFGVLKGARGVRALRKAVSRRCALYGFDPVRPVTDRVVYDDKGRATRFYPEARAERERAGGKWRTT